MRPPSSHSTVRTVPYTALQVERSSCPRRARPVPCPLDARTAYPRRFRRLLWAVASASQPACLHLVQASNVPRRFGSNCSALRGGVHAATMASADFCRPLGSPCDEPSPKAGRQTSQGKTRDFPPTYPPHIRRSGPDDIGLRVYWPSCPPGRRLVCGSCSSGQEFAYHFLQIPPRGGHPCGSARSSCHQGLHRDFHPASQIPARFRSPVRSVRS